MSSPAHPFRNGLIIAAILPIPALADVPRVAVDIAPVHSLVARVMEGVGSPDLVIPPGASPHEHSLRPSEAGALQSADVVFWTGEGLTPWMADAIGTLSEGAETVELLEAEGLTRLEFREGAMFEAHDHAGEAEHDEHDHDEETHSDHAHDGHAHEDHADHEEAGHHDHAHGGYDPHAWLSPENAVIWLGVVADVLSDADPENAALYAENAAAGRAEIGALGTEIAETLAPVRDGRFIVFHDAYQYFETAFDIPASGAISLSDATDPSPARIAEIRAQVKEEGIDCVLAEPQFNPALVATVLDGTEAATGVLDPLGSDLEPGPALYLQLMRNLAATLAECL
jgi:zinc transport system substrate-binding protein